MVVGRGVQRARALGDEPAGAPAPGAEPRSPSAARVPDRRRGRPVPDPALPCHEVVEIVTDYLEGALTPDVEERVEAHLALCDGCPRYLDQMRATITLNALLTAA